MTRELDTALDLAYVVKMALEAHSVVALGSVRASAAASSSAESSRLAACLRRPARSSGVPPSPNSRWKTTCGLFSIGNCAVAECHAILLRACSHLIRPQWLRPARRFSPIELARGVSAPGEPVLMQFRTSELCLVPARRRIPETSLLGSGWRNSLKDPRAAGTLSGIGRAIAPCRPLNAYAVPEELPGK